MVVAKRQRKRKAHKNGTKQNPRTGVRTSGETNLHRPNLHRQAQGGEERRQMYKRRPRWTGACPHASRVYYPLRNKALSCNTGLPFQIFAVARQN